MKTLAISSDNKNVTIVTYYTDDNPVLEDGQISLEITDNMSTLEQRYGVVVQEGKPVIVDLYPELPDGEVYELVRSKQTTIPPITSFKIDPFDFKMRFTGVERIAARDLAKSDPAVNDFFGVLDDPRLMNVDLLDPTTIGGVRYLQSVGVLTEDRGNAILAF